MKSKLRVLCCGLLLLFTLQVQAMQVTINPGNYSGLWDLDLDGNFRTGVHTVDIAAGTHRVRPGTV